MHVDDVIDVAHEIRDVEPGDAAAEQLVERARASIPRSVVANPAATALVVHNAAVGTAAELALRRTKPPGPPEAEVKEALRELLVGFFFGRWPG